MNLRKHSSLRSDMANRVMFGALSAVHPEINNDIIILKEIAKGAKDIITFGTKLCEKEASHNEDLDDLTFEHNIENRQLENFSKENAEAYIKLLNMYEDIFTKYTFEEGYGGRGWALLATGLKNIAKLYIDFIAESDFKKQIMLGNKLAYSMNLLDNLAHNTGTFYSKLLKQEGSFSIKENDAINKLLDSKNLKNQLESLVIAEKNLETSLPFQEKYLSPIRSTKEYNEAKEKNKKDDLTMIRFYKEKITKIENNINMLLDITNQIDSKINDINLELDSLFLNDYDSNNIFEVNQIIIKIKELRSLINILFYSINSKFEYSVEYFKNYESQFTKGIQICKNILELKDKIKLSYANDNIKKENLQNIYSDLENTLNIFVKIKDYIELNINELIFLLKLSIQLILP